MSKRVILTCTCGSVPKRAATAFSLLMRKSPLPPIYSKIADRQKFVASLPEGEAKEYLKNMAVKRRKFAYFFELNEDGTKIERTINLLTGANVR